MLATGVLALAQLEALVDTADLAAAMTLDAFAGRLGAFAEEVHALRPHPGQVQTAANLRQLLQGSTLCDIAYHLVPRFRSWQLELEHAGKARRKRSSCVSTSAGTGCRSPSATAARSSPSLPSVPRRQEAPAAGQLFAALHPAGTRRRARRAGAGGARPRHRAQCAHRQPDRLPDAKAEHVEQQVISAGHFHGMPLALAMSYVKAAIPVLASISERRLNKLVDSATNDGLPGFLIGNEDGTESGFMIVQYTAAAIVNDLASRAMPASVYSIPTSANAEDHVSMGANEARHVLAMAEDLGKVLALELYTAAQALDLRAT
jgi:histidine ammonia-lyase